MDIRQLEVFYHVARLRSFSKAGRFVGLTQPSVSGSISSLERILGVRLFDRTGKDVCLTGPGEALFTYAKQILALRRDALQQMRFLAGLDQGSLLIGASSIPGEYILPRLIQLFHQKHPGIFCILKVSDSQRVIQSLLDHDVEIGFTGTMADQPALSVEPLMDDRMAVCCSCSHPWAGREYIEVDELATQPFLMREEGSGTRKEIEGQLIAAGFDVKGLRIIAEMGSTESIKQAVKSGCGISILSRISVGDLEAAGTIKSLWINNVPLVRRFYMAALRNRSQSPAHRAFVQEMLTNKELVNASF